MSCSHESNFRNAVERIRQTPPGEFEQSDGTCGGQVFFSSDERISRHRLEILQTAILKASTAGGSYDTLAVNLVSAEEDLGLSPEIAEISIVFGTVLNKNCATMSVLLVTVIVAKLLGVPISLLEIALLIPPVVILGLESPGIPGGAGYFMSPVIAAVLHVPNPALWVTTFVAVYSGLIPMFSTAGNTTDDGVVGAILEDRFHRVSTQETELHLQNESTFQKGEA